MRLASLWGDGKPVLLAFGSALDRRSARRSVIFAIYDAHNDRANFPTAYIAEVHPGDEWLFEERREAFKILVELLKTRMWVASDAL